MHIWKTIFSGAIGALLASICLVVAYSLSWHKSAQAGEHREEASTKVESAPRSPASPIKITSVRRPDVVADGPKPIPTGEEDAEKDESPPKQLDKKQVLAIVAKKFDQQSAIAVRDRRAEDGLRGSITPKLLDGAKVVDMECRGTICRFDMELVDCSNLEKVVSGLLLDGDPVWTGPTYTTRVSGDANGACKTQSFFGQPGSLYSMEDVQ